MTMTPYTLKDREGNKISPMTRTATVFDERGVDLDTLLGQLRHDAADALKEYARKTEVAQSLAAKQNRLTTTADLHITDDEIIGLTDMAKKRLFIDLWNAAAGTYGRYNTETGFFELNGLTDITYEQALAIYKYSPNAYAPYVCQGKAIRTTFPLTNIQAPLAQPEYSAFEGSKVEVINAIGSVWMRSTNAFHNCPELREIKHVIRIKDISYSFFFNCLKLESVRLKLEDTQTADIKGCRSLSLESFRYMVDNAAVHNSGATVTVHPDIYARLTDENNTEWHQLALDAASKNIQFITI